MSKKKKKKKLENVFCYWCEVKLTNKTYSREHIIPTGMGGNKNQKIKPACKKCNNERGKVTELYNYKKGMAKLIEKHPERITTYKNRFRTRVRELSDLILKWELHHRQKGLMLPFNLLEIIRLDETMPILWKP